MKKGNANASLKLFTNNINNRILPLNNERLNSLKGKYPASNNANNNILLAGVPQKVRPIMFNYFNSINRKVILH